MADEKEKRAILKENFSANKIPTEAHFHELIDEIALRSNGLEKLKDKPLQVAAGTTQHKVISLHEKLEDKGWSLSLNNGDEPGLNIEDKDGESRLFIDEEKAVHIDGNLYVTGLAYSNNGDLLTSDRRLKDDTPLDDALGLLLKLRGVKYKWKKECQDKYEDDFDNKEHVGFIAQEIEELATEEEIFLGWSSDKGKSYEVNSEEFKSYIVHATPAAFQALTVESIRELNTKIESPDKNELHVANRLRVDGAIQPSVGNSAANGIMFSDASWIRCQKSETNSILEIGTPDNLSNHIIFKVGGNIGIDTEKPKAKLHIKTTSDVSLGKEEGGALILGDSKGEHLAMDNNEIMAKKDATTAGTLYLQNNGGDVSIGGTIKGTVEVSSPWGNWLFLKQERATEGGGGFVIHNPWRDGDSSARNGISIAYKDQQGTVNWGNGINFNGPTGKFTIGTDLTVKGVIRPSAGKSEANGIMFPKNPGGGGSDAAWIRYYPRSGENTILEIGTSNDRADHIVFNASGNIGIGTSEPKAKLHIKTSSDVVPDKEGGGALILGNSSGRHMALDDNEIMAKSNGKTPGKLHLQMQGGDTFIGGDLEVKGAAKIANWAEQSLNTNGYARVGSLLIQWGTHKKNEDKRYDIKFPKAFSKKCFSVVTNRQVASAGSPMYAINITKDKFNIDREDGIHGPQTINWIAVGV
ncbi:MAG: tail fiber domain-containing protein [Candidatus Electrothrix sp. Rat3]|nr:tail fiber domain-containing protein [Candidatus Electrothrix rattekaaiensis]